MGNNNISLSCGREPAAQSESLYEQEGFLTLAGIAVITHLIALCRVPDFIKVLSDEDTSAPTEEKSHYFTSFYSTL